MATICVAITCTGHVAIQISKLEYVYQILYIELRTNVK